MRKITISLTILLLFVFFFLVPAWVYQRVYFPVDSGSEEVVVFTIEKGESVKQIAKNLKEKGLIKNSFIFRSYVFIKGVKGRLQAGEYELSPKMDIPRIVDNFVMGSVRKNQITIIEGWTLDDVADFLEKDERYSKEDFFKAINASFTMRDIYDKFSFLEDKPEDMDFEGYFFPDTYEVSFDTTLTEFIDKVFSNFDKKLTPELRKEITAQNKTIFEIITMASIIEKEVRTEKDKKIVSGILWKRIESGMPMQVDATIAYILDGEFDRILIEDTKIDSLYNTYKYKGLPLGPICNPGIESIEAAIYPQSSPYWFYLSAKNGKTIFSKTFEEHKRAKSIYLK